MKRGILTVISGFSGAGKGTVVNKLIDEYDNYALSISATTRTPRTGELDGREYFFKTTEQFEQMIQDKQLIEYASYVGNYYGTPKEYVDRQLEEGKNVILEIEIQGALDIKKQFADTLLVFITPPLAKELKQRLVGRGTETIKVIDARLSKAIEEADYMPEYDVVVMNDDLEECVYEVHSIIQEQRLKGFIDKKSVDADFTNKFKDELKKLVERRY